LRAAVRFAIEILLLGILAGCLLLVVVELAKLIGDEKSRYFVIGYYVAIHNRVVRWIWKHLRIEKAFAAWVVCPEKSPTKTPSNRISTRT
jgi:hypothetical protein